MRTDDYVRRALEEIAPIVATPDGFLVTTHCIYPSNGFVQVAVRGQSEFQVSDGGGALRDILSTGVDIAKPETVLRRAVPDHGLSIVRGEISLSSVVGLESLGVAIALIANASKEAAEWLYSHTKVQRHRDFKQLVRHFLNQKFVGRELRADILTGASQKAHKFDNVVSLDGGRKLLVDAVVHDANAINASVVANLDVKARADDKIMQRIIYDDSDDWPAFDLSLLTVGATAIPFSRSEQAFRSLML